MSLAVVVMGCVGGALASPVDVRSLVVARQSPGPLVAAVGRCPVSVVHILFT